MQNRQRSLRELDIVSHRRQADFDGTPSLAASEEPVLRAEKMNAATAVTHPKQIVARWPAQPILLPWDRAPWHSGAMVQLSGWPRYAAAQPTPNSSNFSTVGTPVCLSQPIMA